MSEPTERPLVVEIGTVGPTAGTFSGVPSSDLINPLREDPRERMLMVAIEESLAESGRYPSERQILRAIDSMTPRALETYKRAYADVAAELNRCTVKLTQVDALRLVWASFTPAGWYPEAHAEMDTYHNCAEQIGDVLDGH